MIYHKNKNFSILGILIQKECLPLQHVKQLKLFYMKAILLRNLKKGDYFILRPVEEPKDTQVYVRGDYNRDCKKFDVSKFFDVNDWRLMRGDRIVYVEFFF